MITAKIADKWTRDAIAKEVNYIGKKVEKRIAFKTEPTEGLYKNMTACTVLNADEVSRVSVLKAVAVLEKNGFDTSVKISDNGKHYLITVEWVVTRV